MEENTGKLSTSSSTNGVCGAQRCQHKGTAFRLLHARCGEKRKRALDRQRADLISRTDNMRGTFWITIRQRGSWRPPALTSYTEPWPPIASAPIVPHECSLQLLPFHRGDKRMSPTNASLLHSTSFPRTAPHAALTPLQGRKPAEGGTQSSAGPARRLR